MFLLLIDLTFPGWSSQHFTVDTSAQDYEPRDPKIRVVENMGVLPENQKTRGCRTPHSYFTVF